jgi:hypothetical protein
MKEYLNPIRADIKCEYISIFRLLEEMKSLEANKLSISEYPIIIETILIRFPLPQLIISIDNPIVKGKNWECVLNKHILQGVKNFIAGRYKLSNLKYLKDYENCYFDDLPTYIQGRIEGYKINCCVLSPNVPKEVIKDLMFRRKILYIGS